jgi:hypothetical protein
MTFRERIADWISGGKNTRLRDDLASKEDDLKMVIDGYVEKQHRLARMGVALSDIAAMETPGANATVKRMAARAREGLE